MVFQNRALYPHMTTAESIGFHLKIAKVNKNSAANGSPWAGRLCDSLGRS